MAGTGPVMQRTHLDMILFGRLAAGAQEPPERQMNVTARSRAVFDEPVTQILPSLAARSRPARTVASATSSCFGATSLRTAATYSCLRARCFRDVNCADRVPLICTANTTVLETREVGGTVTQRRCSDIAISAPGDPRPGCTQAEQSTPLMVGLVACS